MTDKVFCKNCKHFRFRVKGLNERNVCNHPSVYVKIDRYHPIHGHRVDYVVDSLESNDPYRKNKYFDCKLYEELVLVKIWNNIKRKIYG